MASSLLFKIASTFNNTGFKEAASSFASTLGWVGKLSVGIAKFAVQGKVLGRIFGVLTAIDIAKAGFGLVKYMLAAVPAAGRAEVSFTRLKTQLKLMGQGSKENLGQITKFADQASRKSQFGADEIQSAVTLALRRTGNMRLALKQVSVAQDLASATGMDLFSATNMLSRAQAGYTRGLTQMTNLRQADIQQAVRQGTVLDLVAKKFAGSSSAAAGTYAGKLAILNNMHKQNQESMGNLLLPIKKLGVDFQILALKGIRYTISELSQLDRGLLAIPRLFLAARKAAEDLKKSTAGGKEFTFNFDKELELENAKLGKTADERAQIVRDVFRIEELLSIAEMDAVEILTKEQIDLVQSYQWSNRELEAALSKRVSNAKSAAEKQFEATRALSEGATDRSGILGNMLNTAELISGAVKAKIPIADLAKEIQRGWGISKNLSMTIASIGTGLVPIFTKLDDITRSVNERLSVMGSQSVVDKTAAIAGRLETLVKTELQPKLNFSFDINLSVAAIQAAVHQAIQHALPDLISKLFRNSAVATSKENKAAAPLV